MSPMVSPSAVMSVRVRANACAPRFAPAAYGRTLKISTMGACSASHGRSSASRGVPDFVVYPPDEETSVASNIRLRRGKLQFVCRYKRATADFSFCCHVLGQLTDIIWVFVWIRERGLPPAALPARTISPAGPFFHLTRETPVVMSTISLSPRNTFLPWIKQLRRAW